MRCLSPLNNVQCQGRTPCSLYTMRILHLGLLALADAAPNQLSAGLPEELASGGVCSSALGIVKPCTSTSQWNSDPGGVRSTVYTTVFSTVFSTVFPDLPSTTSTTTNISTSLTTSTAPTSTGLEDAIKACFLPKGQCENMFQNITILWNNITEDTPVWQDYRPFDLQFCNSSQRSAREQTYVSTSYYFSLPSSLIQHPPPKLHPPMQLMLLPR